VALCLGDPVGPRDRTAATVDSFLEYCKRNAWIAVFLLPDDLCPYENERLSIIKIGQEAVVDLEKFAITTSKTKYFRYISRTLEGQGLYVEKATPPHPGGLVDQIESVSNAWLSLPRHREFGFLQGMFSRQYIEDSPLFVLYDKNKEVQAWINQVPSYSPGEATFDMMRHRPGTHWATMDYLFMMMMLKLKNEGFRTLNMGVAPFSNIGTTVGSSISDKAIHRLTDVLDWFVHSEGISNYKDKFKPDWFPRYVAYQGGPINLSRVAIAILGAL
jgi:phosphatidylglycerol lysyltransferase